MAEHTFNAMTGSGIVSADWEFVPPGESCTSVCYNGTQGTDVDTSSTDVQLHGYYKEIYSGGRWQWHCYSYRAGLYFDTSAVPTDAVVTSISLRIYLNYYDSGYGALHVKVLDGMPDYPVDLDNVPDLWEGDYNLADYSLIATLDRLDLNQNQYHSISLPTDSFDAGGLTKFLLKSVECQSQVYPSWVRLYLPGSANPPQLVVDYYVPIQAEAVMTSSSSMTATGAALIAAQASLSSSASFTATPWGVIEAEVSMEAVASMLIRANVNLADFLNWYGTLGPGDVLVIDCKGRTAVLNGANAMKDISGEWVYLDPGDNDIDYTDTAGSRTVEMLVAHRPRWA